MKSVSVTLSALSLLVLAALSSSLAYAQSSAGPAATVFIINSHGNAQTELRQPIINDKPSTLSPVSLSGQLNTKTAPNHSLIITPPPTTKSPNQSATKIVIEIEEPSPQSIYHQVNTSDGNSTMSNVTLPVRDINEQSLQDLTVVPTTTPVMSDRAYQKRRNIPVKNIHSTAQNARLTGSIRGLEVDIYQFNAQQGQTLTITRDKRNPAIEVALFHPMIGTRFGPVHVLPESGVYELRIVQTRQDAATNKTPRYYDISFKIQ